MVIVHPNFLSALQLVKEIGREFDLDKLLQAIIYTFSNKVNNL
jgi:hypothetical protein